MKIKITGTGQVTFFPKSEQDVFALGRLAGRLGKGGTFIRWEYEDSGDPLGVRGKQARDLSQPKRYTYVLQSLTLPKAALMQCIKTHILKEV